jgi:hypothetical protein
MTESGMRFEKRDLYHSRAAMNAIQPYYPGKEHPARDGAARCIAFEERRLTELPLR